MESIMTRLCPAGKTLGKEFILMKLCRYSFIIHFLLSVIFVCYICLYTAICPNPKDGKIN